MENVKTSGPAGEPSNLYLHGKVFKVQNFNSLNSFILNQVKENRKVMSPHSIRYIMHLKFCI